MNLERLRRLGLEVHVTEMDVRVQNGVRRMDERLMAQAVIYRDVLRVCLVLQRRALW